MFEGAKTANSGDASLWRDVTMNRLGISEIRRIAKFVTAEAGALLKVSEYEELLEKSPEDYLGFAAIARKRGYSTDLVGSLLFLAARHDRVPALAMYAGALADALVTDYSSFATAKPDFLLQRRRVRAIRYVWQCMISANAALDFRALAETMEADAAALRLALDTDAVLDKPELQGDFKIVSPTLKKVSHLGSDGKAYLALSQALPMWRSSMPVAIIRAVLELEFVHAADAAASIAEAVAGTNGNHERPILLVGGAGVGKDSLVRRAAELSGRPSREFDLAGSADNRLLRGSGKGWSTPNPSFPVSVIVETKVANPMIQFSELDKAGGGRMNGVVFDTLLAWTEPSSNRKWLDEGLASAVDLSSVCMIFTANTIEGIPVPLRTRLRIIEVPLPRPDHVEALYARAAERHVRASGIGAGEAPELQPAGLAMLKKDARLGRLNLRTIDRVAKTVVAGFGLTPQRVRH